MLIKLIFCYLYSLHFVYLKFYSRGVVKNCFWPLIILNLLSATNSFTLLNKDKYLNQFSVIYRVVLFFLFTNIITISSAQQKTILSGKITDIISKKPIENVHVLIRGSGVGTTTDQDGFFSLTTKLNTIELRVSHISYQTSVLECNAANIDASIDIQLTPKSFELNETVITAKRQYHFSIIDFSFINTNVLVLALQHKNNDLKLFLIDEKYDTISKLATLPGGRQGIIFDDCFGNCHLVLKDSAYQIVFDGQNIKLFYPVATERFYKLMANCRLETPDHLVFEAQSANEYLHSFYAVNKVSHDVFDFITDFEREKLLALKDELNFINKNPDAFPNGASLGLALLYAKKIAFKPSVNFLYKIGDSVYYFNHGNNEILVYTSKLENQRRVDISYHLIEKWKEKIIIDKTAGEAYTLFSLGAKYLIHKMDLVNGTTSLSQIIPLTYPENLKINNGYAYFLYKEKGNVWAKKELYRLKL